MRGCLKSLLICALLGASTTVWADEDDASYASYDSIVNQLEMAAEEPAPVVEDWEEVAIHGGAGLIASYYHLGYSKGGTVIEQAGVMKGFQLHFGMNLFSKKARFEGVFRNYNSDSFSFGGGRDYTIDLKEFEFRTIYLSSISDKMKLRIGGGLAARYMSLNSERVSTPAASAMIGLERAITPTVSFGPDLSYRMPIVKDTFDKYSWDASLKLNAMF
jgi:hypothetical protein